MIEYAKHLGVNGASEHKVVEVSLSLPASLSFCGKMVMSSGSPYGSVDRITPLCNPTINQYIRFGRVQCYKVNDQALGQEGLVLTKFFSEPN